MLSRGFTPGQRVGTSRPVGYEVTASDPLFTRFFLSFSYTKKARPGGASSWFRFVDWPIRRRPVDLGLLGDDLHPVSHRRS